MPIGFVGAGAALNGGGAGGGTLSPALPSHTTDDLLLAFGTLKGAGVTDAVTCSTSGWALLAYVGTTSPQCGLFWKRAASSAEANPTIAYNGGSNRAAQACAFRDAENVGTILDGSVVTSTGSGTSSLGPISPCVPTQAGVLILVLLGQDDDWADASVLTGDGLTWAEIGEPKTSTGSDIGSVWDYAIAPGAAPTLTNKTFTTSGGPVVNTGWRAMMLAIKARTIVDHLFPQAVAIN